MAYEPTKEEVEFAKFACNEFATFGFNALTKVQQKKMQYRQYIHEMLLLVLGQFQGDVDKCWRFLHYALDERTVIECQKYVISVHEDLENRRKLLTPSTPPTP